MRHHYSSRPFHQPAQQRSKDVMKKIIRNPVATACRVALGMALAASALADPVGGDVDPINTLTSVTYVSNIDIVGASGLSNVAIVSGTVNNNDANGWDLTVTSANLGILKKGAGGAGRQLAYTNVVLAATGGTLGAGLTSPAGTRNIATGAGAGDAAGTTHFYTHTTFAGNGTATAATANYTFELRISAAADATLLSGSYSDDITLQLDNDS
jgi:hypothetical protein